MKDSNDSSTRPVVARRRERRVFTVARWGVLLAVLIASTVIGLLHQKAKSLGMAGVDALCPFGGIESLWALLTAGILIKKIAWASVVLLVGAVLLNLAFGRAFCGQFCPLGTLQELFGNLRGPLRLRRAEVPKALDVPARFLKYLVFGVFTWLAWLYGTLVIRPYDPWVAYHHLTSAELFASFGAGAAILGVSLLGSVLYDRFFCKYLCPTGAFLGLFSRLGFFRVTRHADACIDCGACDKVCPANIEVSAAPGAVKDAECIACAQCVVACPNAEALSLDGRGGQRLSPLGLVLCTAVGMAVLLAVTKALGIFSFTK